jgi:UDP-N-acetylmuramoyl-L-alanyl-D-glutamate--2,6-diaminopimelate ligase
VTLAELVARASALVPVAPSPAAAPVPGLEVTAIEHDSRRVTPGAVFCAVRGQRADGTAFAEQARAKGAVATVADVPAPAGWTEPWFVVGNARAALAAWSAVFYRHPSEALLVIGVTGTNGKTTTAHLLRAILEAAGRRSGLIGTTGYVVGSGEREAARTTPEAPEVQRMLREMVDDGCQACAMEVSSHALALHRADHLRFSAAVFTNLTRDHLDFHGSMEAYFLAKRRLFEGLPAGAPALVNADDPYGVRLAADFGHATTYGLDHAADVTYSSLSITMLGLDAEVATPLGSLRLRSRLAGRPNAYNVLASVATAVALGLPGDAIERGIAALASVPGRFQTVSGPEDDITVVVDYAHTDDALRNLLETARPLTRGRVIVVFGCGGDRDRTKRPLMGAVAARLSDLAVLTSDNPRSEDPAAIIEDMKKGMQQSVAWTAITDRREAISYAIGEAHPGDLVLVAGKGHERYQETGGRALPFDDVEVSRSGLAERRSRLAAAARESR